MQSTRRQPFGYRKKNGEIYEIPELIAVARRVIELRDSGMKLEGIRNDADVRWTDGRKISVATICEILKNRGLYTDG